MNTTQLFTRDRFYFLVNPFHLVEARPWPLTGSVGALFLTVGTVGWFHGFGIRLTLLGLFVIIITIIQWWRDVVREGSIQGYHTTKTARGLRVGVILFIVSEVCFFFAFFWAFFHSRLAPTVELGNTWPPIGINPLSPWGVPLLNTLVLLSSGVSVTWAHHALLAGNMKEGILGLLFTVALGLYFTTLQGIEYIESRFSIRDRVYGTTFFVATGFHGLHVLIGTTFLLVCLVRHRALHFTEGHHFGFEAAAWYWHFVDVVWLFLYVTIYWWGR